LCYEVVSKTIAEGINSMRAFVYLMILFESMVLDSFVLFFSLAIGGHTFHSRMVSSADALAIVELSGLLTAQRILK
jgi:hypothetical protein